MATTTTKDRDAALLTRAFAAFNETSDHLASAYRELEQQVVELSGELDSQKRLAAVGEAAASLAHQLRTPLASALLYLGPLEQGELGPVETRRAAAKSLARLRQIDSMINDMLMYTRRRCGGSETITPGALLHDAVQILAPQLAGACLECVDEAGDAVLRGNRQALLGAVLNLANNALEAAGRDARVRIVASRSGSNVAISVSDNGPGIDAPVRERLFEPFFTTRSAGTGLGLAVVRSVVEAHGGTVEVTSDGQSGATFSMQLPQAGAHAALASGQSCVGAAREANA
jgi:two-component system sensor histidine kinase FlrB